METFGRGECHGQETVTQRVAHAARRAASVDGLKRASHCTDAILGRTGTNLLDRLTPARRPGGEVFQLGSVNVNRH